MPTWQLKWANASTTTARQSRRRCSPVRNQYKKIFYKVLALCQLLVYNQRQTSNKRKGFLLMNITVTQIPSNHNITVRGGELVDGVFDLDWCNHAGAELEEVTSNAGLDNEYTEKLMVCNKCEAQLIGEEWL